MNMSIKWKTRIRGVAYEFSAGLIYGNVYLNDNGDKWIARVNSNTVGTAEDAAGAKVLVEDAIKQLLSDTLRMLGMK